jgi:hypothetical protein
LPRLAPPAAPLWYLDPVKGKTTLSFRATKVTAEVGDEVQTLGFEIEVDGEPSVYFTAVNEAEGGIRVSWGDGKQSRDECVVTVAAAALEEERFTLEYKEPDPERVGPYRAVEIAFEALDEDAAPEAAEAFGKLFGPKDQRPVVLEGPRRRGTPSFGLAAASRDAWRVKVGGDVSLDVVLSNTGGPVSGIALDVAGPAVAAGQVEVVEARTQGKSVRLETKGGTARGLLEHVRVEADLDIDRKGAGGKGAPRPPSFTLTVVVRGKAPGQQLLTLRAIPRTADGRGGAMVGRTIVVEP